MTDAPSIPTPDLPASPPQEHGDTLMAMLRTKRKRQAKQRQRIFELPGYDGLVGAKLAQADERGVIADSTVMLGEDEAGEDDAPALFDARRRTIARACVGIFVRDDAEGEWKSLAEQIGSNPALGPVKFDERFVQTLEDPSDPTPLHEMPESATETVKYAMSSALPFLGFYGLYAQWCAADAPLAGDELVGESSAAS